MSRKPHQPTDRTRTEVQTLASFGTPQAEIALYIGIDKKTLLKHYRDELDVSQTRANANVHRFLYRAASGSAISDGATHSDCIRAAIFWAKTRSGWSEKQDINHTSSDGSMTAPSAINIRLVEPDANADD